MSPVEFRPARGRLLPIVAVLLTPLAAAGCHDSAATPSAPPPPEVGVVTVAPRPMPLSYEFVGEVQPIKRVEVRARVDGVIESRPFTEGAFVKAGDVLYRLERIRSDAAYRNASAQLANAQRTLERLEPLAERQAVAQQEVDDARTQAESAQAALDEARKDRADAVVRAEISGRVGRTRLEVGARVTGPSDLLTTVEQLDPVYVSFRPSSQDLLRWRGDTAAARLIRPGSPLRVHVVLPDGTELPRTGRLGYVSPSLDPETGTQEFRATFANRDLVLVSGQFVRVRLEGFVRQDALAIPRRAVQQSLGRQFVLVASKGDTVRSQDVTPGPWSGESWIIEKGIAPGDRVIVDGLQKTMPGGVVHPVPADTGAVGDSAGAAAADSSSAAEEES
ncbi:MAG TPA: efflux RND transporter periplasmic adaptor subunit [Gemmatimonadales bacterium]|nr:efflux RND transporter periplasmic adaptor subunit [Gemmatimonadales bacterium]